MKRVKVEKGDYLTKLDEVQARLRAVREGIAEARKELERTQVEIIEFVMAMEKEGA